MSSYIKDEDLEKFGISSEQLKQVSGGKEEWQTIYKCISCDSYIFFEREAESHKKAGHEVIIWSRIPAWEE